MHFSAVFDRRPQLGHDRCVARGDQENADSFDL